MNMDPMEVIANKLPGFFLQKYHLQVNTRAQSQSSVYGARKMVFVTPPLPLPCDQSIPIAMKQLDPGDSSRDLFIPDRWRSPLQPFQKGHVNSPSQKGHDRRIARMRIHQQL